MNVNDTISSIAVLDTDIAYHSRLHTNDGDIFADIETTEELIGSLKMLHRMNYVLKDYAHTGTYKIDKLVDLLMSIIVQYETEWNETQLKFSLNLIPKTNGLREAVTRIMEI